ncbi:MAG: hypothetical protein WA740_11090 [Candidatus Binataceae bacterium]
MTDKRLSEGLVNAGSDGWQSGGKKIRFFWVFAFTEMAMNRIEV